MLQLDPKLCGDLRGAGLAAQGLAQAALDGADAGQALGIHTLHRDGVAGALDGAAHGLAHPEEREGGEAVAAGRVVALNSPGESDAALLDQVQQIKGAVLEPEPGDEAHNQAKVRLDEALAGPHPRPECALLGGGQGPCQGAEGHGSGNPPAQLELLLGGQQGVAGNVAEVAGQGGVMAAHRAWLRWGSAMGKGRGATVTAPRRTIVACLVRTALPRRWGRLPPSHRRHRPSQERPLPGLPPGLLAPGPAPCLAC